VRQPGRGKSRKGDRPPVPASTGGAVAEPAGEPNNRAAAGLATLLPVGGWTEIADHEEERGRRKA